MKTCPVSEWWWAERDTETERRKDRNPKKQSRWEVASGRLITVHKRKRLRWIDEEGRIESVWEVEEKGLVWRRPWAPCFNTRISNSWRILYRKTPLNQGKAQDSTATYFLSWPKHKYTHTHTPKSSPNSSKTMQHAGENFQLTRSGRSFYL